MQSKNLSRSYNLANLNVVRLISEPDFVFIIVLTVI